MAGMVYQGEHCMLLVLPVMLFCDQVQELPKPISITLQIYPVLWGSYIWFCTL